ncbi:MAG: biotin/lipoyl-containing protein [Alphaproteobacteria bacterium]
MELSQEDIAEIQRLLEASSYSELIVETARQRITLRRAGDGWIQETQSLTHPNYVSPLQDDPSSGAAQRSRAKVAATEDGLVNVFPPLPGTFYRAPKPGADPFVEVGSIVNADSVIGIIETMKLMNPARAGVAGTIVEICAANGQLMEEAEVLMRVRPQDGAPT